MMHLETANPIGDVVSPSPLALANEPPTPPRGKHLVLYGLDWDAYRRISDALTDMKVRLTYDRGRLEIMGSSLIHERWTGLLAMFVYILSEEMRKTLCSAGSTTLDREDLDRGIEPDRCFYIENEPRIRANRKIDLHKDPPPDLAIETEVSHRAIKQLPIYEAIKVPEVWRTDGKSVTFHVLQPNGSYEVVEHSRSFPFLRSDDLVPHLQRWGQVDEGTLHREFRDWVRQRLSAKK